MNTNPSEIGIELDGVADQLKEERGAWRSCSGCHELNEGVAQGPWSYILECNLGMGCHECGGLGAVWDNVDYSDFGRELAAPASVDRQEAPNRGSQTSLTGADGSQAPASAAEPETKEQLAKRLIAEVVAEDAIERSTRAEATAWKQVPTEATDELLKDATKGKQVLAYENGRYYNAWLDFDEYEGGWLWTDEADSEPNPSHYMVLPSPPLTTDKR